MKVDLRDVRKVWGPDCGGLPCGKPLTRGAVTLQMEGGSQWEGVAVVGLGGPPMIFVSWSYIFEYVALNGKRNDITLYVNYTGIKIFKKW